MFQKTLIIGLGLIGGSFAKAIRENNLSKEIFACDYDLEAIDYAKNLGVINGGVADLTFFDEEINEFDFVVIATPLSAYEEVSFQIRKLKTLVIDLGSVKNLQLEDFPKNFVPCHPIAGSENSGFEYSDGKLFAGKKFIYCKENPRVLELIKKIGALPEFLEAKKHDEIYALVSHLPQFLSFLTAEFSPQKVTDEFFKIAFRLDNSDPDIWSDIIAMNEENLEKFYDKFFANLEKVMESAFPVILSEAKDLVGSLTSFGMTRDKFGITADKFFEENFAAIFFRALVVKSFLEIPEIRSYQNYAGSGFRDFTSIIAIFNYDAKKLENLFAENRGKILKFFKSLQ